MKGGGGENLEQDDDDDDCDLRVNASAFKMVKMDSQMVSEMVISWRANMNTVKMVVMDDNMAGNN